MMRPKHIRFLKENNLLPSFPQVIGANLIRTVCLVATREQHLGTIFESNDFCSCFWPTVHNLWLLVVIFGQSCGPIVVKQLFLKGGRGVSKIPSPRKPNTLPSSNRTSNTEQPKCCLTKARQKGALPRVLQRLERKAREKGPWCGVLPLRSCVFVTPF